jgi:phage gpG-like protein
MADGMTLRIVAGPEVMAALAARRASVSTAVKRALFESLNLVSRKIAFNLTGAVLHVQTGRLRQSMQTFMASDGFSGGIGTNVEYARIHEFGGTTRPHQIPVGIRIIHHPGATIPARPYMRPALEDSREDINKVFVTRLAAALKGAQ